MKKKKIICSNYIFTIYIYTHTHIHTHTPLPYLLYIYIIKNVKLVLVNRVVFKINNVYVYIKINHIFSQIENMLL